jgi:Fanconi anemia group M protein
MIKPDAIERREYQVSVAESTLGSNTLVVLPTGLGKTVVALLTIAEYLKRYEAMSCVLLAPTRVLVHQHHRFLQDNLAIPVNKISVITGEDYANYREDMWDSPVICATPQIMKLDMKRELVRVEQLSLLILDEAHRATGEYAYTTIAANVKDRSENIRIIGMTASIPSDNARVKEIFRVLGSNNIEFRDNDSEDVKPYIQETDVEWIELDLPENIRNISALVKSVHLSYVDEIRNGGFNIPRTANLMPLLETRQRVERGGRYDLRVAVYSAIRLVHALALLETQGVSSFLKFVDRLSKKTRAIGQKKLLTNSSFQEAYEIAKGSKLLGLEHPKLSKLHEVLSNLGPSERAIVFASYRDSVDEIYQQLIRRGHKAGVLIGKSGDTGQSQADQIRSLERLKNGEYDILIATQVGEEGLDVSECKLVVFYDNVSSAVRYIQRRGRTGRRAPGRVVSLIAKGTRDEAYRHLVNKRMQQARRTMSTFARNSEVGLDDFLKQEQEIFG